MGKKRCESLGVILTDHLWTWTASHAFPSVKFRLCYPGLTKVDKSYEKLSDLFWKSSWVWGTEPCMNLLLSEHLSMMFSLKFLLRLM